VNGQDAKDWMGAKRGRWVQHIALPLLAAVVAIACQVVAKPMHQPVADERVYVSLANDLRQFGIFTHAGFDKRAEPGAPGRFFAPAYPALLAATSLISTDLAVALSCYSKTSGPCGGNFLAIVYVQVLLAAGVALLVFWIGVHLSGSLVVGWLTMGITIASGELGSYARAYLTEILTLLTLTGFLYFTITAYKKRSLSFAFGAGIAIGLCTLVRPSYLYLYYAMVPLLSVALAFGQQLYFTRVAGLIAAYLFGGLVIMGPWMLRNYGYFGDFALTEGYGAYSLAVRVAYNDMSWSEWFVSFVYWLPDFGDSLAKALFPAETYVRLAQISDAVTTYYELGHGAKMRETLAAAGGREKHLGYLLKHDVLGDWFKHLMVTVSLALRGMWAGKYLALIGVVLLWPVAGLMVRRKMLTPFLLFALPLFFMVWLVSLNVVRYNIALILLYAFIISMWVWCELGVRLRCFSEGLSRPK